jgi:GTP pyrophosphokinase
MHAKAEYGIAAHWSYKEAASAKELAWMQRITDADTESSDPVRFLESIKADLEQEELYVFTPKGRVIALSADSTPVDFAYAVHTEIGHRCIGAKVNGRLVPLDSRLASADTVEILTAKTENAGPSRDWVNFVGSSRARNKIKQWFSRERRDDALELGREALTKELRRESMPIATTMSSAALSAVAESMNLADDEALFVAIGEGQMSASSVIQRLLREMRGGEEQIASTVTRSSRTPRSPHRRTAGVWVEGLDDVMVHLAKCCTPVPGDQIIGFVTQGRGVSVHRSDCSNAEALSVRSNDRIIEVEWDASGEGVFRATLEVLAFDRSRLLADITQTVSEHRLNIVAARTATTADRVSRMIFDVELADPSHLESLINSIRTLDGVFDAYRVLPGARR